MRLLDHDVSIQPQLMFDCSIICALDVSVALSYFAWML
jgi:hypothetical protein